MNQSPRDLLALALDNVSSMEGLSGIVKKTAPFIGVFKIGLEQFTRFGAPALEVVRRERRKIFLDLKFHDIPNTVGKAVEAAAGLDVDFLTIHTSGGMAMMRAAVAAAKTSAGKRPKIIGVTLLTSIDAAALRSELSVAMGVVDYVRQCAVNAVEAGLDGIVCSAADLAAVKPLLPSSFSIITPGIRPAGSSSHDQKRIATPEFAIANGATLLVLGRAVTDATDPGRAAEEIMQAVKGVVESHSAT